MVEFLRPMWLWGLAALPLVALALALGARARRSSLARFVGSDLEPTLAPGRSWRRHLARGTLRTLALGLLVVAAAGPRFGSHLVKVEREGIDLIIALDTSLSMLAEDVPPNRLDSARREISDLIEGLNGDRVGIVAFAGDAVALCPLTVDYDAALMLVRTADVYTISEPGSSIAEAINVSLAMFEGSQGGDKAIILVTDGENQEGDPVAAARAAHQKGVRVFAIGMGTTRGELIPERGTEGNVTGYKKDNKGQTVLSRLDEAVLERVASAAGGRYLPATPEGIELKILYDEISGMQQKLIKGEFVERKKDRFLIPLALAFGLLAGETLIGTRGRRRRDDRARVVHTGAALFVLMIALVASPALAAKQVNKGSVRSGNKAYKEGEWARAFSLYREAVGDTAHPLDNAQGAFYNGGNALYQQKQYGRAVDYYQRSFSPDSALTGRMLYNRGNALMKGAKLGEAIESYIQALQYLPDDEDARHNLEMALALRQQNKQQQQQKQPSSGNQGDEQNESEQGSGQDSTQTDPNQQEQKPGDQNQQKPDSSQTQPSQPDSTQMREPQPADSTGQLSPDQMQQISPEDAMRILQALADREEQLQKERRKAAFRKLKRSGKDW